MRDFSPQQVRFLQAVGDIGVKVHSSFGLAYRYLVNGSTIHGRGMSATFDGLVTRGALARAHTGQPWTITPEAKAQLAAQLARPQCDRCGQQVRTVGAATGDMSRRFLARHKLHGFTCPGSRSEVIA